jgi:16S rRNA (uracil1498-N3)-methyltransferase
LILSEGPSPDGLVRISGKDFRYIARVLRMGVGDRFRAVSPSGRELSIIVVSVGSGTLVGSTDVSGPETGIDVERSLDIGRRSMLPSLPPIVLLQALPKGQKMDLIVRQATEAGIALILPFTSERSVSRPESGRDAQSKRERWERIVREARQQSGSDVSTAVAPLCDASTAMATWKTFRRERGGGVGILLHQNPLAQGTLHGYLSDDPPAVALAVGPEGGFSATEAEEFMAADFAPVLIGANVLRTETAALFAIAAVQTVLLEKTSWMLKTPCSPA